MKPIVEHPRNEDDWLLFSKIHGWITGRFSPGYWEEHHEYGRQYNGPVWVLGDDITQVEVEEGPDGFHDGEITHFMPCPEKPNA